VLIAGVGVPARGVPLPAPMVVTTTAGALYAPYVVAMPAGTRLRLVQLDPTVRHDVVSRYVRKGKPLFATKRTLSFGQTALVNRVEKLRPAFYPFTCSIHPQMVGQLVVR
jgi:plastocyanin